MTDTFRPTNVPFCDEFAEKTSKTVKESALKVFALSDPHLALGTPGKEMDRFGAQWVGHADRIAASWRDRVHADDLVLVPGDLSWALKLAGAQPDLDFLSALPGTKVFVRGNHDLWWASASKVRAAVGDDVKIVQGDCIEHHGVLLAGTRLWDAPGLSFEALIDWVDTEDSPRLSTQPTDEEIAKARKIWVRELGRLDLAMSALERMRKEHPAALTIGLTHYPPIGPAGEPSPASDRLEAAGLDHVVFGHLHAVKRGLPAPPFGTHRGVQYHLTSCDYLDFVPKEIATVG